MPADLLGLLVLTAWRVTHLITVDDFPPVRWARRRVVAAGPEWLGDLVTCTYCAGVWVAAGGVLTADAVTSVPYPWLVFGGLAAAIPIIEAVVSRLERVVTVRVENTVALPTPPAAAAPPPAPTTYRRPTRPGEG